MPDRIANKIILAEDREHQNLVRRYLERCGHGEGIRLVDLPAKSTGGSGEKYVRDQYANQVKAVRSALGKRASALLIVVADADSSEIDHRERQLSESLATAGLAPRDLDEPIVVLIPKRHVETWIRALLGSNVDEVTDYKSPRPEPEEIRKAALELHAWTRDGAQLGATSPPSLTKSIPEWRRIPS